MEVIIWEGMFIRKYLICACNFYFSIPNSIEVIYGALKTSLNVCCTHFTYAAETEKNRNFPTNFKYTFKLSWTWMIFPIKINTKSLPLSNYTIYSWNTTDTVNSGNNGTPQDVEKV